MSSYCEWQSIKWPKGSPLESRKTVKLINKFLHIRYTWHHSGSCLEKCAIPLVYSYYAIAKLDFLAINLHRGVPQGSVMFPVYFLTQTIIHLGEKSLWKFHEPLRQALVCLKGVALGLLLYCIIMFINITHSIFSLYKSIHYNTHNTECCYYLQIKDIVSLNKWKWILYS